MANKTENTLGLVVPQRVPSKPQPSLASAKTVEQWIGQLPIAHIGETARLVYQALAEINRRELNPSQRGKILELFRQPVSYLIASLDRHYIGHRFPLSEKASKTANLACALLDEMAIGYKVIIESNLDGIGRRVDSRLFAQALYGALDFLSQTLMKRYQIYQPIHSQLWLELNHLYLFAEHNNINESTIKTATQELNTISGLYKRALLLAIANPYRFSQKQIALLFDALSQWSNQSRLFRLADFNNSPGLFAVNLEKGEAPIYYIHNKKSSTSYMRALNTNELTRVLRAKLNEHNTFSAVNFAGLDQETVSRLVLAWGAIPKRSFSRIGKNNEVDFCVGINPANYFLHTVTQNTMPEFLLSLDEQLYALADETNSKPLISTHTNQTSTHATTYYTEPSESTFSDIGVDVWDLAQNPSLQISISNNKNSFSLQSNSIDRHENYQQFNCQLVNESAGGYRIHWQNAQVTTAIVGSIISIHHDPKPSNDNWNIGVIRWLKTLEQNSLEVGIELLATQALAVSACKNTGSTKSRDAKPQWLPALLLPQTRAGQQRLSMILPTIYHTGEQLHLLSDEIQLAVQLNDVLEKTGSYAHFEVSLIPVEKSQSNNANHQESSTPFDMLWSSI
ncbi:MAG: hypothetical protein OEZ58_04240 [Gammaproteobacteria bacterium]|nr:hypothetical protein [Gammaproteobacteria bacterium]MDH5728173.1 hypothetical protein [Gammaproteobacteria bacterium]